MKQFITQAASDFLVPNGYFVEFYGGKEQPRDSDSGDYPLIGSGGQFGTTDQFNHEGTGVIFGRKGTIDKPFAIQGKFWMIDTAYFAVPNPEFLDARYYAYWAETVPFHLFMTNTARPSTTARTLAMQKIPLYSLPVQRCIADYLDQETGEIDGMAAQLEELLNELLSRRKKLITDVVTCQKRIGGKDA